MKIRVKSFTGAKANEYKKELAELRIKIFREYPYLYDGTLANEEKYLENFIQSDKSIIVVAFDKEQVIGVSTGMPMKNETDQIKQPWIEHGVDISRIFYFSESVLLKPYRGRGIGVEFFKERERWASQNKYEIATFCGVIRQDDDPRKPTDYVSLEKFWINRGYRKKEGYTCKMSWKEINGSKKSEKELQFWDKNLGVVQKK